MSAPAAILPGRPLAPRVLAALALTAWVGLPIVLGLWLSRPEQLHQTALWVERAQRLPVPVLDSPDRASLNLGGGPVQQLKATARVLELYSFPTDSPVVAIAEGPLGLAVATFDEGAFLLEEGRAPRPLALGKAVNDLAFDDQGRLLAATDDGALRLERGAPHTLAQGAFSAVAVWKGRAVFSSRRGLSVLRGNDLTTFGKAHGLLAQSPAALADCAERLCIGAVDGLWTYDLAHFERHSSGSGALPTDHVTAVGFSLGRIWAGTFDAGLARLGPDHPRRFAPSDGLPEGRVQPRALALLGDTAFAATPSGLLVLRGEKAALVTQGLPRTDLTALRAAAAGGVWVGYAGGVGRVVAEDSP